MRSRHHLIHLRNKKSKFEAKTNKLIALSFHSPIFGDFRQTTQPTSSNKKGSFEGNSRFVSNYLYTESWSGKLLSFAEQTWRNRYGSYPKETFYRKKSPEMDSVCREKSDIFRRCYCTNMSQSILYGNLIIAPLNSPQFCCFCSVRVALRFLLYIQIFNNLKVNVKCHPPQSHSKVTLKQSRIQLKNSRDP